MAEETDSVFGFLEWLIGDIEKGSKGQLPRDRLLKSLTRESIKAICSRSGAYLDFIEREAAHAGGLHAQAPCRERPAEPHAEGAVARGKWRRPRRRATLPSSEALTVSGLRFQPGSMRLVQDDCPHFTGLGEVHAPPGRRLDLS